ncbi:MAG: hypothetical protein RL291_1896 [Pseudomonadota bacterium]
MRNDTAHADLDLETERTIRTQRKKVVRATIDATAFIGMALVVAASVVLAVIYH